MWQKLIDKDLVEWSQSPEQFAEEGLNAPTPMAISSARSFAQHCRNQETDPPLRMSADGSGGIVFEWRVAPVFCMVEIGAEGQIELLVFENCKLVGRLPIG